MRSLRVISVFMGLLVIMLPICFATQMNLVYDANGNLVTGDGKFREYDSFNQLSAVYNGSDDTGTLLIEYVHHPTEERVLKKHDYVKNETTYYFSENFARIINSSGIYNITFVYHNGQLVAEQVNNVKTFIHSDHLSSSTVRTSDNGSVLERTEYSPFGSVISGGSSKLDYEAEEYDDTLGEYDFDFRMYKSEWGMFTKPDTLIPNVYDPQSLNRYMFERGNPLKYEDETGHEYVAGPGDAVDVVNLYIVIFGFFPKARKQAEEKARYETLYDEWHDENDELEDKPYKDMLYETGYRQAGVRDSRTMSLDYLESWKLRKDSGQTLPKAKLSEKPTSTSSKTYRTYLVTKNFGEGPTVRRAHGDGWYYDEPVESE